MDAEPRPALPKTPVSAGAPPAQRFYLYEPGWTVTLKVGSERTFCYQMAPGQDYYHRLLDGEIYLQHNEERLCLACAQRRGLLTHEPRLLGAPLFPLDLAIEPEAPSGTGTFDLQPPPEE